MYQKMLQIGSGGVSSQLGVYKFYFIIGTGWQLTNPKGKAEIIVSGLYEDAYIYANESEQKLILKDIDHDYVIVNAYYKKEIKTKGNTNNYWGDYIYGDYVIIVVGEIDDTLIPE